VGNIRTLLATEPQPLHPMPQPLRSISQSLPTYVVCDLGHQPQEDNVLGWSVIHPRGVHVGPAHAARHRLHRHPGYERAPLEGDDRGLVGGRACTRGATRTKYGCVRLCLHKSPVHVCA
jgi:hypothetical protein